MTAKLGSYLKEFQNDSNGNTKKNDSREPLIDCGTDLVRFEAPEEISGLIPNGHEDQPKSTEDQDPTIIQVTESGFDSDSDDNFADGIDFDRTGDLVDSLMEESVNKAAA